MTNRFLSPIQQAVDYQTAHQEIIRQQEKRLRQELNEEKQAALSEIEAERKANEKIYTEKMERLKLEQFKYNFSKELFETEQKALLESEKKSDYEYKPFQSTILDDIDKILRNHSKESLHTVRLMVREATQRCQDLGMFYEFRQTHVADERGQFRTLIKILDHENYQTAEWPSSRLEVWLERLRENDVEPTITKDNLFSCMDMEWRCDDYNPDESCMSFVETSFNSSKISLNLSAMKDAILGTATKNRLTTTPTTTTTQLRTPSPVARNGRPNAAVKKILFGEANENTPPPSNKTPVMGQCQRSTTKSPRGFDVKARSCLRDLQVTVNKLKVVCGDGGQDDKCKKVARFIDEIELMLNDMKTVLSDKEINLKNTKFFMD